MNKQGNRDKDFDEVNLADIQKATVSLLDTVGFFAYKTIRYFTQKWIYIGLGLVLGLGLGYVKYNGHKKRNQTAEFSASEKSMYNIIVAPKYNSIDYLDQLAQTKFADKLAYTQIDQVEIEGLDDVFYFLRQDSLYVKAFQSILAKGETVEESIHNYAISKNYPYQVIKLEVKNPFDIQKFIADLQNHLNQQPYFAARKKIENQALVLEKQALEDELKGISAYASIQEKKPSDRTEQAHYIALLKRKNDIFSRLKEIEVAQIENEQVLFVLDYIENNETLVAEKDTIEKQIAKDIVKLVLLFLIIGMGVDFIKYYRTKE